MDELTRFLQLRPAQKLSDEQKLQVGLPLYPGNKFSPLANLLRDMPDEYVANIEKYKAGDPHWLNDLKKLHEVLRTIYQWLEFKARPVRFKDFEQMVQGLPPVLMTDPELESNWFACADSLLVAIEDGNLHTKFHIDYQLLIRTCYVFKLCIEVKAKKYHAKGTEKMLNELLAQPVLLPDGLLNPRCCENCNPQNDTQPLPQPGGNLVQTASAIPQPKPGENIVDETAIALPQDCKCSCEDEHCQEPSNHCMCVRTYVGDLYIIKEELARYEEGDIADIENVLAGEKKIRRHRNLYRTEDTLEQETETITSQELDHQVSEKFSLQDEVKSTVDSKIGFDAGVTATLKYGENVTITPHANVTGNFSKSDSHNIARSYAKDVVDRSVSKMQEKVRRLQVSKVISELEDRSWHSIENTDPGAKHRAGIFYWVNKVTHAQVFNYGKHMLFDAIIPEPAAVYKKLYSLKLEKDSAGKIKPKQPELNGRLLSPLMITENNYGDLLSDYGVVGTEELQPPDGDLSVQAAFSYSLPKAEDGKPVAFSTHDVKTPSIPPGYKADKLYYSIRAYTGHPVTTGPNDEVVVLVSAGKDCIMKCNMNENKTKTAEDNKTWFSEDYRSMNGEEGIISVAISGFSSLALAVSGTISVACVASPELIAKWQNKVYNALLSDYYAKLAVYNESINNISLIQIKGRNPFLNREIERNELKRHIIAMLMCNYFKGIGSMMEKTYPCGFPEINFAQLEKDAPVIQFFEQVFEWNYATYLFYSGMWARKCKWPDMIDEDSGDPLFDKFLTSGASRVQVPVRPGMEGVFNWFLKTGQIWGASGIPPIAGDDEYVSMIQELKESKQGDYTDRPGLIEATKGSAMLKLTDSSYYWDFVHNKTNTLNMENDKDREILIDFKVYRIVQVIPGALHTEWQIELDRPFEGNTASKLKHAVGALYVGAPWEIRIPTKLVYLRNDADKLPTYPLK